MDGSQRKNISSRRSVFSGIPAQNGSRVRYADSPYGAMLAARIGAETRKKPAGTSRKRKLDMRRMSTRRQKGRPSKRMLLEDDKHRWDAMGGEGGEVLVASTGERERTTLNEEEDGSTKTRLGAHYEGGPNELGCQGKGDIARNKTEKCDVPVLKPDLGKARK